jgi:hypothetical protein
LTPFLIIAGALCGLISKKYGWATVRPVAWALVGGIVLRIYLPIGWSLGGAIGGAINGLIHRSKGKMANEVLAGVAAGLVGWITTIGGCLLAFLLILLLL